MVRDATIALEDRNFYTNIGVNFAGIGRAFISNLRGQGVQGASSITRQLVKNVLIDPKERYRSPTPQDQGSHHGDRDHPQVSGPPGKDQILEWYLNYNFYGNAAYGVEAAAQVYYNKPWETWGWTKSRCWRPFRNILASTPSSRLPMPTAASARCWPPCRRPAT